MKIPGSMSSYLTRLNVPHEIIEHKTVFTAYDLGQTLKTKLEEIAKTLLVKADKAYHLVVLRASDRLDVKKLQKLLGARSVSIAREQDMVQELKVKPGAITPFGGLHKLGVVMERGLSKVQKALFGSGSFEHSIRMRVKDFLKSEKPLIGSFGTAAGLKLQATPRKKPVTKSARRRAKRS